VGNRSHQSSKSGTLALPHLYHFVRFGVGQRIKGFIANGKRFLQRRYQIGFSGFGRSSQVFRLAIDRRSGARL